MPEEPSPPAVETDGKQLCLGCLFPNEPMANFCAQCGAPLTSYAATGPFEHLFAEGHTYRQAAERPRKLIVVLGIWLIFGGLGLSGIMLLFLDLPRVRVNNGIFGILMGAFLLAVSVAIIWKTTHNYLTRDKSLEKQDESQTLPP